MLLEILPIEKPVKIHWHSDGYVVRVSGLLITYSNLTINLDFIDIFINHNFI